MNDNMRTLINALRGGEYTQGKDRLRDAYDDFCCLGVATDLFIKAHPDGPIQWVDGEHAPVAREALGVGYEDHENYAPPTVCAWLGLEASTQEDPNRQGILAAWNDNGESFSTIATRLETGNWSAPYGLGVEQDEDEEPNGF